MKFVGLSLKFVDVLRWLNDVFGVIRCFPEVFGLFQVIQECFVEVPADFSFVPKWFHEVIGVFSDGKVFRKSPVRYFPEHQMFSDYGGCLRNVLGTFKVLLGISLSC